MDARPGARSILAVIAVLVMACQSVDRTLPPTPAAPTFVQSTPVPTAAPIAKDAVSALALINAYGADYPAEFAGAWINGLNGDVVSSWTKGKGPASHRDWIEAHVDPAVSLAFRGDADYSLAELESLRNRISGDRAWFDALPGAILDLDILENANKVLLEVATDVPSIRADVQIRFGYPGYMLEVETYPAGTETIPWGTFSVVLLDKDGKELDRDGFVPPVSLGFSAGLKCDTEAVEDQFVGLPCIAGPYRINVFYRGGIDCFTTLGGASFHVVPDTLTVVHVKTRLDAPATFGADSCTWPPTPR